MMNMRWISLAVLSVFFISCNPSKKTTSSATKEVSQEMNDNTKKASSARPIIDTLSTYHPSRQRDWDLLHTALDLSFDWQKQDVIGSATLKLTPLFYAQQVLNVDADHFKVNSISLFGKPYSNFKVESDKISIQLPRPYKRGEEVSVTINYIAHPEESPGPQGTGITSDRGLFFIDPMDTIPDLPRQIWTQGETSYSRKWYPTLDQLNEKTTQEITLTVPDSMMTLSNGVLVSSTPVENRMRKDYWKMDLPHAPCLFMIAVGQWDKVSDSWRGIHVDYYVDKGYGKDAKHIFSHTPEMMEFFSSKLNVPFAWPKYSQIIVRNFVSGAMENTTASVFGEFVQFHQEDVIADDSNEYIVAHELFHQWFGDLVTCESWANLTLNEGFADYSEYLWKEYKYGREEADIGRLVKLSEYFDEASESVHPLIHYHYPSEESMFDAHSYNKGGLVVHMLRDMIGDEAFFTSLHNYLEEHKFSTVEEDDLRQAFESTTGQDLHWFFDQWYFGIGHPVLEINQKYNATDKKLTVSFEQTQDKKGFTSFFRLPIDIDVINPDSSIIHQKVWMDQKEQTFTFDASDRPIAVIVDPRDILLTVQRQNIDPAEYPIRAVLAPSINQRLSALRKIDDMDDQFLHRIMNDSSWYIREVAVQYLTDHEDADNLYAMAQKETKAELQKSLLESLIEIDPEKAHVIAPRILKATNKVPLIYTALNAIAKVDPNEAAMQFKPYEKNESDAMYAIKASIYAQQAKALTLDYFKTPQASSIDEIYIEDFIHAFAEYLSTAPAEIQQEGIALMKSDYYLNGPDPEYRMYYIITGISYQYYAEDKGPYRTELLNAMRSIYKKIQDDYLKGELKAGFGNLLE